MKCLRAWVDFISLSAPAKYFTKTLLPSPQHAKDLRMAMPCGGLLFYTFASAGGSDDHVDDLLDALIVAVDGHADVPRAPDNGTQVADRNAVADTVDGLLALDLLGGSLAANRSGNEADAVDNAVALDEEGLAGLNVLDGAALVGDLGNGGVQVNGNLVVLHSVTQEGGVGKAGSLRRDKVAGVLDDDRVLAEVQQHVVSRLAGGLAAADEQNLVADFLLVLENVSKGEGLLEALDLGHHSGGRTGSDDDIVEAAERVQVVDLGVHVNLDAGLLDLALVPSDEFLVVLFEGHCGSSQEQTAQLIGLLEEDRDVALLLEDERAFHTADTAADDGDSLGLLCGCDVVSLMLHGGRVQSAAAKMQGVHGVLEVRGALVLCEVEAAVVAADAGLDLVLTTLFDLMYPLVVDEVLTCDSNCIQTAGGDLLSGLDRIHTACADDGSVGEVLDVLDVLQVAVVGHVLWRMCPVPCVVGAVVAVEHCVAGLLEVLDSLLGLFHVAAELLEVLLVRHSALAPALGLGDDGVTQGDGEVVTGILMDALDDLDREAEAVLEGSAVLVGTEVPVLHGELVEQVTFMDSVDLNAIDACIAQLLRGLTEGFDHFLDLGAGHGTGLEILVPAVGGSGSGRAGVLNVNDGGSELVEEVVLGKVAHPAVDSHGAAEAGGELNKELGTGLVELFHVGLEFFEHTVVLPEPLAAGDTHGITNALHTGEDQADAVLRAVEEEVGGLLVEVVRLQPTEEGGAAHGTLYDAVRYFHIANLPRSK